MFMQLFTSLDKDTLQYRAPSIFACEGAEKYKRQILSHSDI